MQEKIDKELNRPIKEAREGIVLLIDQWDRLSDADQVSLLAEECYKVADGISMAAETAELFNEALAFLVKHDGAVKAGVRDQFNHARDRVTDLGRSGCTAC